MSSSSSAPGSGAGPALVVTYDGPGGQPASARFSDAFTIGRAAGCDVQLEHLSVSREHARVERDGGGWVVVDLNSHNGVLVNGELITRLPIAVPVMVRLASDGPFVQLAPEGAVDVSGEDTVLAPLAPPPRVGPSDDARAVVERYLLDKPAGEVGEHTELVRKVIAGVRRRDSRRYIVALSFFGLLLAVAAGLVVYQELRLSEVEELSVAMFYDMKSLELQVARLEKETKHQDLASKRTQLRTMMARYQKLLERSSIFSDGMSAEERLILRVARVFGECELNVPKDFVREVMRYIKEWQSSDRLPTALARLQRLGYTTRIRELLQANGLPVQFGFVALQESNFNERAVGPPTRFGHAKGMWQFIPSTASEYGLHVGQRFDEAGYDPADERFDFDKATGAAARYLRDIYMGEAQASGLLVLASYNWGHNRVRALINKMPENPRERNFWKLLKRFNIPDETYGYVFMIFSAAVIAEDPKLFGFDFESPFGPRQSAAAGVPGACESSSRLCYL